MTLPDNSDPNLSIQLPFLVSSVPIDLPLIGFNAIEQLMRDFISCWQISYQPLCVFFVNEYSGRKKQYIGQLHPDKTHQ